MIRVADPVSGTLVPIVIALIIGILAGFLGGVLGVGGGIIMVPLMLLFVGPAVNGDIKQAKGASLLAITVLSVLGAMEHHRKGHVDRRAGTILGVTGTFTAILGTVVSQFLASAVLEILFGVALLGSSIRMLVVPTERKRGGEALLYATGMLGGFMAGLLGIGGGVVMVQGMVYAGIGIHTAVGTSLMAIAFNAVGGAATHAYLGLLPFLVAVPLALGGGLGVTSGARMAGKTEPKALKHAFALMLAVIGVTMIARGLLAL